LSRIASYIDRAMKGVWRHGGCVARQIHVIHA
jgi:hypothetical protein